MQSIFIAIILLLSCKKTETPLSVSINDIQSDSLKFETADSYDLNSPLKVLIPSSDLNEISGLSYLNNTDQLISINDEQGKIFVLDTILATTINTYKFGKSADYEGIERVADSIYIIRSNGNIHSFPISGKSEGKKYKTPLTEKNDIEGLGYDTKRNCLLLACKADPWIKSQEINKEHKAVYTFDLEKYKLSDDPDILISVDSLIITSESMDSYSGLSKYKQKELKLRIKKFAPSGIAIHPISDDIYILSAQGKLLVVLKDDHSIRKIHFLDDGHAQAEGICFDNRGRLFISNEARGLSPKIFVYDQSIN